MMVIEFEHGQFIPDRGYWCEFCQTIHSARSCYHPAYRRMKILEQQNAALVGALEAVEWVPRLNDLYCPWCENRKAHGHTDDCQRQQALALVEGKDSEEERWRNLL